MKTYAKRMTDAAGDDFQVEALYGSVYVNGDNADTRPDYGHVANLDLTPQQALRMARALIKAAAVAYEQVA